MAEHRIRILHLSDLHERGPREGEIWRRRRVLGEAWERNLDAIAEDGAVDLVCFTGDAADWGLAAEYEAATEFLDAALARLGLGRDRLFIVPGNHDIARETAKPAWKRLRRDLPRANAQGVSRWLAGGETPLGLNDTDRDGVLERQGAYRDWLNNLGRADMLPAGGPHPNLGYRATLRLAGRPFDLHVIGLDSAWLAGDDADAGKLLLTDDQVMRLTSTGQGDALAGFRLALIHHPLDDLADAGDCRRRLAERVDLLLRGHLHEAEPSLWADPQRALRQVAAGCLYEGHQADQYPNECHVIDLALDDDGRPLAQTFRFRSWSARGHWFDDDGLYADSRNGRLTVRLAAAPAVAPLVHPRVEDLFVGRRQERDALAGFLFPASGKRRPVAVTGMAGVGKSYLVDRFYVENTARFPGGYLRLAVDPLNPPDADGLIAQIADRLQLAAGGAAMAAAVRERMVRPLSLLHLENADSPEVAATVAKVAARLDGCAVVISGRLEGLGGAARWGQVKLRPFDAGTALAQLDAEMAGETVDRHALPELARALGYLPLALHLAAGHLRTGLSAAGFLDTLRRRGLDLEPADPADPVFQHRSRAILSETFDLSLDLLRREAKEEGEPWLTAFSALGHGPAAGFGLCLGAAIAGLPEPEFERLAVLAGRLSLLERVLRESAATTWRLHPLPAELLCHRCEQQPVIARMSDWFIERMPELESGQEDEQGRRWREVQGETPALIEWLARVPLSERAAIADKAYSFAANAGPFHAWTRFCEEALKADLDDADRSKVLWTFGNVALRSGFPDRAEAIAEEKRALDRKRGADREEALAAGLIADILYRRGEFGEAERIRREDELPVYERLGDVRSKAVTMGKIADILFSRGELEEAERIRREDELPVYERLGDVREKAATMGKIADILQSRGDFEEAEQILREVLLPAFEQLGEVRLKAVTMGKIADILFSRGDFEEAERIRREEQLPVYERLGDVREKAVTMGKIADILFSRGDFEEAERIRREEQLPVYERLGDVRSKAVTMGKIADILFSRGDFEEAERIRREEQLPVYERLGDVRLKAVTMGKIADILQSRGELEEAERIRREDELPVYERLGDVRSKAVTMGYIADILQSRGELEEAERIRREELLPVYERLGDVRELLVGRAKLAMTLLRRDADGNREEAGRLLSLALGDAQRLGLPEAAQIEAFMESRGMTPDKR
jgi:tetratricopeptide (TPR) repeat protein/predicted MPP superfamily phosphohydrolase